MSFQLELTFLYQIAAGAATGKVKLRFCQEDAALKAFLW
jgi:hypothetical protein